MIALFRSFLRLSGLLDPCIGLGFFNCLAVLLAMLLVYRRVPGWVVAVSLIYPAFYATLSILIDPQR